MTITTSQINGSNGNSTIAAVEPSIDSMNDDATGAVDVEQQPSTPTKEEDGGKVVAGTNGASDSPTTQNMIRMMDGEKSTTDPTVGEATGQGDGSTAPPTNDDDEAEVEVEAATNGVEQTNLHTVLPGRPQPLDVAALIVSLKEEVVISTGISPENWDKVESVLTVSLSDCATKGHITQFVVSVAATILDIITIFSMDMSTPEGRFQAQHSRRMIMFAIFNTVAIWAVSGFSMASASSTNQQLEALNKGVEELIKVSKMEFGALHQCLIGVQHKISALCKVTVESYKKLVSVEKRLTSVETTLKKILRILQEDRGTAHIPTSSTTIRARTAAAQEVRMTSMPKR